MRQFKLSPDGKMLVDLMFVLDANYASGSGAGDIFQVEFSSEGILGKVVKLSNTDQIDELFPHWNPKTGQVVAFCPVDMTGAKKAICLYDPVSGERQEGAIINLYNPQDYQISPQGDRIASLNINNSTGGKGVLELRLFDWNGKSGPVLASKQQVDRFEESPDSRYFAYIAGENREMHLVNISTGEEFSAPGSNISWMGWVR